jgi:glycerophosphoryl diester phosphodiesterase
MQVTNLKYLNKLTDLPLIQMLGGWPGYVTPDTGANLSQMVSDAGLDEIAAYAAGVGAWKDSILPSQASGYIGASTGLVQRVQSRGMQARHCALQLPACPHICLLYLFELSRTSTELKGAIRLPLTSILL